MRRRLTSAVGANARSLVFTINFPEYKFTAASGVMFSSLSNEENFPYTLNSFSSFSSLISWRGKSSSRDYIITALTHIYIVICTNFGFCILGS